jgi:16S rRNA (cytidine1402-2'-O)-methyltransferase
VPLVVCATPIGNLADVTLRVLDELRAAELVLCEDTRRTRVLLAAHGITAGLLSLHDHNQARRIQELVPRLVAGERMALVSDAGLPGISDPGVPFVRAALDAGVPVTVLPGPSAVETALVVSGLAADRYTFIGFLPRRASDLDALWAELRGTQWPVVAFESPQRLPATLRSLATAAPAWEIAICRELTKQFEEVTRGSAAELAVRFVESPKGEITLVLVPGPASNGSAALAEAAAAVSSLAAAGAPRRLAVDLIAGLASVPRNELYRLSLTDESSRAQT